MEEGKKIYFVSDAHLGLYPAQESLEREKLLVTWLKEIREDAAEIYLLGDIFDYWYEFRKVIPRGFTRFLGAVSEITDSGIPVHFFTGNHDVWVFDYLPKETGVIVHREPLVKTWNGKKFYMAHGDGLGPGDKSYKLLKWAFTNKVLQWVFSRLHPNFSVGLGHAWSKNSRQQKGVYADFKGTDKEWLILHSGNLLEKEHYDFFIYGHRHIPMEISLGTKSRVVCLGDWIVNFTYAVFDGNALKLLPYTKEDNIIRMDVPEIN